MSNATDERAAARSAHRFLVTGLVAIGILAVLMGVVVGWIRPEPVVPALGGGGAGIERR